MPAPNAYAVIMGKTTPGIDAFIGRRNVPGYNEVFPHVKTDQTAYRRILVDLVRDLGSLFPPERNEEGELTGYGIPSDWSEFRTVQAVLPSPAGTPPFDSTPYAKDTLVDAGTRDLVPELKRERERYAREFTLPDDVRVLADEFMDVFMEHVVPTSFPIKRTSSMGLPHMTADVVPKAVAIRDWLEKGDYYADLIRSWNLKKLSEEDIVLCYFNGYRAQLEGAIITEVDGVSRARTAKDRQVMDWRGEWKPMDRTLPEKHEPGTEEYNLWLALLCARSRAISASPFKATLPLRVAARAIEKGLGVLYSYTFKHRELADIERKVAGAIAFSVTDVKSHDQMMHFDLVLAFCRAIGLRFGSLMGELALRMFQAPMLVRNDYRSGSGATLRGNPLDLRTFTARYANPSGIPPTSGLAKAVGCFYIYLAGVLAGIFDRTRQCMKDFLSGKLLVKLLNLGDNNLLHTTDDRYAQFCREPWRWMPYAILEKADTFAGYTVVRDARGAVSFMRNITTFVKNIISPDRSLGHPMKGNWAVSLPIKRQLYSTHPAYERIHEILDNTVIRHLGASLDELAAVTPILDAPVRGANLIEADFLNNPESIEYKYDAEDVRKEFLELFYITGTVEDAKRILDFFT